MSQNILLHSKLLGLLQTKTTTTEYGVGLHLQLC